MTKTEEAHMLRDIKRTAAATERIAKALEQLVNMAKYDAEDYITLGSAVSEGMEAGMKEESKTVDRLYVVCDKEGNPLDILADKEEAERIVAANANPETLHIEEFGSGDVISVQKIKKEKE